MHTTPHHTVVSSSYLTLAGKRGPVGLRSTITTSPLTKGNHVLLQGLKSGELILTAALCPNEMEKPDVS